MSVAYGTINRPHFERDEDRIVLVIPEQLTQHRLALRQSADERIEVDPEYVRELVIGGIHALEDQAHEDLTAGRRSSATLAWDWIKEAVLRQ